MMMDEVRLALYDQSEANAVFRAKRGEERESRGEGRRKIKQKKNMYKEKQKTAMPAVEPSSSAHASNYLTTPPWCHSVLSVFSEVNLLHENHFQVSLQSPQFEADGAVFIVNSEIYLWKN